jgi:hypothetical protein
VVLCGAIRQQEGGQTTVLTAWRVTASRHRCELEIGQMNYELSPMRPVKLK